MPSPRKSKIIIYVAAAVYLLDRLTKLLVMRNFRPDESVTVIRGFFELTYIRNTGAAFGMFALAKDSFRIPFILAAAGAAIAFLVFLIRKTGPGETLTLVAFALILGGAAGNFTDRLLYQFTVVDFIYWHVGEHYWPAFNIADSGISVGVALLGYEVLSGKHEGGKRQGHPEV